MTLGHLTPASKDAMGLLCSGVGMYMSFLLAFKFPDVGAIDQFFKQFVATVLGVGAVASAVAIAWPKVMVAGRGVLADLTETKENVQKNQDVAEANAARIAALEKEAVILRAKAADADVRVHTAHKLARDAMNLSRDEVSQIKSEAAAEIAALKKDLAEFHEKFHVTNRVVNKLNLESEVREREARKSNDPDAPTHIIIDNIERLAALDALDSSDGIPVVVVDKPKPDPKAEPEP